MVIYTVYAYVRAMIGVYHIQYGSSEVVQWLYSGPTEEYIGLMEGYIGPMDWLYMYMIYT